MGDTVTGVASPFTCACCEARGSLPPQENEVQGLLVMCKTCGHLMIYDTIEVRNLNQQELVLPSNRRALEDARQLQEAYCMKQGWWG